MKKLILALTIIALIFGAVSCNGDVDERLFSYTVSFVSNGGTEVESQIVKRSNCAEKPENPTFGDYTFNGWFEKGSSTEFNFDTPINEDITLYAHWDGVVETKVSELEEINLTAEKTLSVAVSPVAGDSNTTVVTIPANAITGTGSTSQLSVTSYSIEVSPIAFTILETSGNNLAVAGIDCILKIDDVVVSDFEKPVIVTTYIPKGLSSVEVVYNGDDGKAQPITNGTVENPGTTNIIANIDIKTDDDLDSDELGYSAYTGKLRFMTTHFSEFYVATNAEVCIVNDSDSSDISAMTLKEFRDFVNSGNDCAGYTVTLLKDVDLTDEPWVPIGIYADESSERKPFRGNFDGSNKTIKLKNTDITAEEGYEYFGFFAFILGDDGEPIEIKNLVLDVNFASDCPYMNIGGLSSQIHNNVNITNVKVKGSIDSTRVTGGIYGDANCDDEGYFQNITDCIVEAALSAHSVRTDDNWLCIGGILGQSVVGVEKGVFVENCKFTGTIETFFDEEHDNNAQSYLGYVMGKGGYDGDPYDKTTITDFIVGDGSKIIGFQNCDTHGVPFEGYNKYENANTYTGEPNHDKELLGGYFTTCIIDGVQTGNDNNQQHYPHGTQSE